MAAYLNRTLSMVTGSSSSAANGSSTGYDPAALIDAASSPRGLHTATAAGGMVGHNDVSPLQIFVRAKKKINDIFGEIEDYVVETTGFIDGEYDVDYRVPVAIRVHIAITVTG